MSVTNYCTLFDSNYLTRGLVMYQSLKRYSKNFHLYIFAFDNRSYQLLNKLDLEYATVISLKEFEDEDLLRLKATRSPGEYCWTCTPSIIKYSIESYNLDGCTYLDADLCFYSDPSILLAELGDKSTLITEHRYTPNYDLSSTSGIYCVQFVTFKNNADGMQVLNWWREACNEWCYAKFEDGKFGDQKYLDNWPSQFKGVHELQHLGGGVAPWNVQQYEFSIDDKKIIGTVKSNKKKFDLVFYHFHAFKFLDEDKVDFGNYVLDKPVVNLLYKKYISDLKVISDGLKNVDSANDYNGKVSTTIMFRSYLGIFKRIITRKYNVYSISRFKAD